MVLVKPFPFFVHVRGSSQGGGIRPAGYCKVTRGSGCYDDITRVAIDPDLNNEEGGCSRV